MDHDLTKQRYGILDYARTLIDEDESVSKIVDFAFADRNCKLRFKASNNNFYGFSSCVEFLQLVNRLGAELFMDVAFKEDEKNNETYY